MSTQRQRGLDDAEPFTDYNNNDVYDPVNLLLTATATESGTPETNGVCLYRTLDG
jgi:hypothetical protein